ncbi:hypothetical protein [uncultured Corynebacterium sp.]|uniref:hypothetical protein n=1 Tax=uncultured Corynebacterium sp. TaxID=159447 RepID=UPI002613792E|nr:hypothetical protein [uncultured Corynebacterium sp.]
MVRAGVVAGLALGRTAAGKAVLGMAAADLDSDAIDGRRGSRTALIERAAAVAVVAVAAAAVAVAPLAAASAQVVAANEREAPVKGVAAAR